MMIDRPTWPQFYYWCGTEIWLIYCSSANHCFTIVYCFIPYLTRRKWGLRKYWSLQSIQWYLLLTEYWPRFFVAAICLLGQWRTNPMKIHVFGRKNSKAPTTNYDSISVSSVGVPIMRTRERHLIFGILTRQDFLPDPHRRRRFVVYILK